MTTDTELYRKDATLKAWETLTWVFIVVSLTLVMVIRIAMGWSRDWQTYPPFWYGLYLATAVMMLFGWVFLAASLVSVVRRSQYRARLVVDEVLADLETRRREWQERSLVVMVSDEMKAAPQWVPFHVQEDPFGTTCVDCGRAIGDEDETVSDEDGNLMHVGCGDR